MKKVVMVLFSLLLLASVGIVGVNCGNDDKETVTWRLNTYSLEGSLQTDMLYKFIDKVEQKSDGKIKIEMFAGGSLYQLTETFDAVSSGAVDLGFAGVTSYSSQQPKTFGIMSYANVVTSSAQQVCTLLGTLAEESPAIIEEANAAGIKHLFYAPLSSLGNFYTFKVEQLSDMAGKTLGCTGGVSYIVQAMGATPKPMEFLNFAADAQNGLVDGWVMAPIENYLQMGLESVAPYVVNLNFIAAQSILMNQGSFDALTEDLQKVVMEAASETEAEWIDTIVENDQQVLQDIEDSPDVEYLLNLQGAERDTWFNTAIVPIFYGAMANALSETEIAETQAIIDSVLAS